MSLIRYLPSQQGEKCGLPAAPNIKPRTYVLEFLHSSAAYLDMPPPGCNGAGSGGEFMNFSEDQGQYRNYITQIVAFFITPFETTLIL